MRYPRCTLALAILAGLVGCGRDKSTKPPVQRESDSCSNQNEYTLLGQRWPDSDPRPVVYVGSSLPSEWRSLVDSCAATWNRAGSRLRLVVSPTVLDRGAASDGVSVISFAHLGTGANSPVGYAIHYVRDGRFFYDCDIMLNGDLPLSDGGDRGTIDVRSILTHELGHFCGLGEAWNDDSQTMHPAITPGSRKMRTLCGGDVAGLLALYGRAGRDSAGPMDARPGHALEWREESPMLYMVIEHFRDGNAVPVYRRFRDEGRLAPEGLGYVASWVTADLKHCYQVMECADPALLDAWIARWSDLVQFEVVPVITSPEALGAVAPRL
jgi:hypothetical protein